MDIIIAIILMITLILGLVVSGAGVLASVIGLVLGIVFFVYRFAVKSKLGKVPGNLVSAALLLGVGVSLLFVGFQGASGGFYQYEKKLDKIYDCIDREKNDKAAELIEEAQEEFGYTDSLHLCTALNYVSVESYDNALSEYNSTVDKTSEAAFLVGEAIFLGQEDDSELEKLYYEAADLYPEWEYMQICAGVSKVNAKEYGAALNYLYKAYRMNDKNPTSQYFLGVASYNTGDKESALYFFDQSIGNGADEKTQTWIRYYLDEMGYFQENAE